MSDVSFNRTNVEWRLPRVFTEYVCNSSQFGVIARLGACSMSLDLRQHSDPLKSVIVPLPQRSQCGWVISMHLVVLGERVFPGPGSLGE